MFRNILLPTDGTAYATITVPFAHDIAERFGGRIELLRVLPPSTGAGKVAVETAQVEQVVASERSQGFKARAHVELGNVEEVITETARTQHSDLIILAPQPRYGLDRLVHPSVTAHLVGRSLAPVLVVPEPQSDVRDLHVLGTSASLVIVPVDGSAVAERAIPYATALADEFNRVLMFVHVLAPGTAPGATSLLDAREVASSNMRRYLSTLRRHVALETGLPVQSMLLTGDVAQQLTHVAVSHEMSLIVMSTHGRGGLARAVLGSVTTEMLRKAAVPLLIVPPPEQLVVSPAYAEREHSRYAQHS